MDKEQQERKERLSKEFLKYEHYWRKSPFLVGLLKWLREKPKENEFKFDYKVFLVALQELNSSESETRNSTSGKIPAIGDLELRFYSQVAAYYNCYFPAPKQTTEGRIARIVRNPPNPS